MKIPLRFQMTESDSGKTTLLNTISYLFDREQVDSSLIKSVYKHSINENNILLKQETICDFAKKILDKKKYNLELYKYDKEEVNIKRFNSMTLSDYSLGPIEHRECLIIKNNK